MCSVTGYMNNLCSICSMKNNLFLLTVMSALASFGQAAESVSVSNVEAFTKAWNEAIDGTIISLTDSFSLSDEKFTPRPGISVSVDGGGNALIWQTGATAQLPSGMVLNNTRSIGAPGMGGEAEKLRIGSGNTFENNRGPVQAVSLEVGKGNTWQNNIADGDGAALRIASGGTATIAGNNSFTENHAFAKGGAIRAEEGATVNLTAATNEKILFAGNTQLASVADNGTVTPGMSNDISLGATAKLIVETAQDAEVSLSGGVVSDSNTASLTKKGAGVLKLGDAEEFLGAIDVQDGRLEQLTDSVGNAKSLTLHSGSTYALQAAASLLAPLSMQGATLEVAGNASLLSPTVTLSGANTWNFLLSNEQLAGSDTVLSLSPELRLQQNPGSTLSLNLDLTRVTSAETAEQLVLLNSGDLTDVATKETLGSASLSVTDKNGEHTTTQHLRSDGTVDMKQLLQDLGTLRFDRPGRAAANALWSSADALRSFAANVRGHQPRTVSHPARSEKSTEVWALGMGYSDKASGAFTYSGGGYAIGATQHLSDDFRIGIALGQMFGTNKAELDADSDAAARNRQEELVLGLYGDYTKKLSAQTALFTEAVLAYGTTENDYSAETHRGSWTDTNFFASLRTSWQYRQTDGTCIAPFIGLEWTNATQDAATFAGAIPWKSAGADLRLLSLPVGVTIRRSFETEDGSIFTPSLEVLYRGDLCRTTPKVIATDGSAFWESAGFTPGRSAAEARVMLHLQVTDAWSLYATYTLESRSDRTLQRYTLGTSYAF